MSRSVSIDAMNKISYCLTYHSFWFYISKLLYVTFILYFLYSFSFSPRRRFVFQTEISWKYIVFILISLLFYLFSSLSRGNQSTVFLPWMPEVFSLASSKERQSKKCWSARDLWFRQLSLLSAPIQSRCRLFLQSQNLTLGIWLVGWKNVS